MKTKRKVLAILVALAMITLIPVMAFADSSGNYDFNASSVKLTTSDTVSPGKDITFSVNIKNNKSEKVTLKIFNWYYRETYNSETYPGVKFGTISGSGYDQETGSISLEANGELNLTLTGTIPDTWSDKSQILVVLTSQSYDFMGQGGYPEEEEQQGSYPDQNEEARKAAAEAKDNLNKVVEDAKKIGQGNYTDESFKALQDAIAAAETLAKDEKATAEQLKAAADKVTAAKAALQEKAPAPVSPPAPPAPAVADGQTEVISGSTVEVTSAADKEVAFKKARKGSKATVPATVNINGESYKVTSVAAKAFKGRGTKSVVIGKNVKKLDKNAFYGSTVTTVTLKTKVLTKAKVKGSLKGSKVKTIKVKVGGKAQNKKFVKKYKPYFTKANAGKAATVK